MARRLVVLARQVGFKGLFAGLGPRVVMTAGLVSGQFLLYGSIKDGWSCSSLVLNSVDDGLLSDGRSARIGDP